MSEPKSLSVLETLAAGGRSALETLSVLRESLKEDPRSGAKKLLEKYEKLARAQEKEQGRIAALWVYEREASAHGAKRVAGIDEAGRGPLVGAVLTAAVVLPEGWCCPGLNDSKKLTPEKREKLFVEINRDALAVGVGRASAREIDELNIYKATQTAMERAVKALDPAPDFLLTDAMPLPALSNLRQKPLIHGDSLSASIAAASIIAKVTRDREMEGLDRQYPGYGFLAHKGYGTEEHLKALREKGPCPEHRVSFGPVLQTLLAQSVGAPVDYWKGRITKTQSAGELKQVGHQIKRLGTPGLDAKGLEALREEYRLKMAALGGEV
jgi:ribonuclease HII